MRDLINDGNYEYELIGLIKHLGDSDSGHNIAICKNFFDSIWYVYDDYQVTQLSNTKHVYYKDNIKHLDTSDGFLFFYKRENCNLEVDKDLIIEKASEIRK